VRRGVFWTWDAEGRYAERETGTRFDRNSREARILKERFSRQLSLK
jgi:hypothetical protein